MNYAEKYTQEELEAKITSEIDFQKFTVLCEHITDSIRDILNSCGLYFRIFSRVKSVESIALKLLRGSYGTDDTEKKIQDLLGLRVVLYYYDDLSICRDIMEDTFQMVGDWSRTNFNVNEFRATKTNGVFRYPAEYFHIYDNEGWELPIDMTFEIQFRTVFFEGWHEIEHDMRYKSFLSDNEFWMGSEELARILNCILANLELSDWSLVQLFEQLAYNHYRRGNWELMLKSRFRIKMDDSEELHPDILSVFNENRNVAKQFFKCSRHDLIRALLKFDNPHVNYNLIIALLNDEIVHDSQIDSICKRIVPIREGKYHQKVQLARLDTKPLFHLDLLLLHKDTRQLETEFAHACAIIYRWCRFKFNPVFEDIPSSVGNYKNSLPGYHLNVLFDPEKTYFEVQIHHIDSSMPGTIWNYHITISPTEDGRLHFCHTTTMDMQQGTPQSCNFVKPPYLPDLSSKIGIVDVLRLGSKAHIISVQSELSDLKQLIAHPQRRLPLIFIAQHGGNSDGTEDKLLSEEPYCDEQDMNTYTINGTRLAKVIGLYAHVYMAKHELLASCSFLKEITEKDRNGCICIFWPAFTGRARELYTKEMVYNARFDFNRLAFHDSNVCEKAFRHQLVQIVKDYNTDLYDCR